jgi:methionine-rich copper-binding protein CopC
MRLIVLGAAVLVAAAPASAHSLLLESSPAAGAVVAAPPAQIALRFNNRIEKPLSSVRLLGPDGAPVTLAAVVGGAPDRLVAAVPALGAGRYRVEWRVLSADGHLVSGAFSFAVAP